MGLNIPTYIVVHHTGGSNANPLSDSSNFTFDQCNELHRVNFNFKSSLGFYIGYHYYIDKQGRVRQGRADIEEGAHTIGRNKDSIGVCLAGNFDATDPTLAQVEALRLLLKVKSAEFNIPPENIVPHRKFASKTCYGNRLGDDWARNLVGPVVSPQETREQIKAKIIDLVKKL